MAGGNARHSHVGTGYSGLIRAHYTLGKYCARTGPANGPRWAAASCRHRVVLSDRLDEAGLAGGNIEDFSDGVLYDEELAVARIAAARAAADASGTDFVLTARTDGRLLSAPTPLSDSIRRANRYREAGADCLYIPGVNDIDSITTLVREVDGPLNVVLGLGPTSLTASALRAAGVTRISLGGSIARAALGFVRRCARELVEDGTVGFAADQIPQSELNQLFAGRQKSA